MKSKMPLLLGILFLLSLASVSAQPPFSASNTNGIEIKIPEIGTLQQNQNFTFNFHLYNQTNGVPIDNSSTSCYLHLYSPNGFQVFEGEVPHSNSPTISNEWEILALDGNFSVLGDNAYVIQCNSTTLNAGGFNSVGFEVTVNGQVFSTGNSISYLGFIVILLFTFILTLYGASKIKWGHKKSDEGKILTINNFRYLKVFLFSMAYLEIMFLFGLSYKFFNEANIQGFTDFFNFIYQLQLSLIFPLMVFLIVVFFLIWINNRKLQKRIKLGLEN